MLATFLVCIGGALFGVGILAVGIVKGAANFRRESEAYGKQCVQEWSAEVSKWSDSDAKGGVQIYTRSQSYCIRKDAVLK